MAVVWPPQLPTSPLLDGYEETAPTYTRRSAVDAGPPKVGRRFTANVTKITCQYSLTREQLVVLDEFYFAGAGGGAVPFEWPHPWRHVAVRVRFTEPPKYSNAGHPETAWLAAVALEILPPGMPV